MRREINFFSVYRAPQESDSAKKFNIAAASLIFASLFIILSVFVFLKASGEAVLSENQKEQAYLKSSEVLETKKNLENAAARLSAILSYKQAAQRVSNGFESLPKPDSEILAAAASKMPSDVTVTDIDYNKGTLTLSCTGTSEYSPAVFVHSLEESAEFRAVNYTGLTRNSDGGGYSFTVRMTLKGGDSE